jgi:hypothetical protein
MTPATALAVKVMAEAGVDIAAQYSKTTAKPGNQEFDFVIRNVGYRRRLSSQQQRPRLLLAQTYYQPT